MDDTIDEFPEEQAQALQTWVAAMNNLLDEFSNMIPNQQQPQP